MLESTETSNAIPVDEKMKDFSLDKINTTVSRTIPFKSVIITEISSL